MYKLIAVTLASQSDAEAVREALLKLAGQYGGVTVGDYLDLIGSPGSFSDEKEGWAERDLVDLQIKQVGENEFLLDLPKPKPVGK
jgi:hypothetical protein